MNKLIYLCFCFMMTVYCQSIGQTTKIIYPDSAKVDKLEIIRNITSDGSQTVSYNFPLANENLHYRYASMMETPPVYKNWKIDDFKNYFSKSIAKNERNKIIGITFKFVVDSTGLVKDISFKPNSHPQLQQEINTALLKMEAWVPGKDRGKLVDAEFCFLLTIYNGVVRLGK